jgi:hypothetical protein
MAKLDKWQRALNIARRAGPKLTLPATRAELFRPIESELHAVESMTGCTSAASLVSLAALGYKTIEAMQTPPEGTPLDHVTAQGRAELRLSQLTRELGAEQVWQIIREWTYGTLELSEDQRVHDDMGHAIGALVRRLDGVA